MESRMSLLLRIICNICRGLIVFQVLFLVQVNSFLLKHPVPQLLLLSQFTHQKAELQRDYRNCFRCFNQQTRYKARHCLCDSCSQHCLHCSAVLQTVQLTDRGLIVTTQPVGPDFLIAITHFKVPTPLPNNISSLSTLYKVQTPTTQYSRIPSMVLFSFILLTSI